jgi:aquaporin Z
MLPKILLARRLANLSSQKAGSMDVDEECSRRGEIGSATSLALAFCVHWRLYVYEALELATFMLSACVFTVWLFDPAYPAFHLLPSSALRRLLMGVAMGATAVGIILSPLGKMSGAHFNPAITLTYLRLKKIRVSDACFYVLFQFLGGVLGVGFAALILGKSISVPGVDYAITVPGKYGVAAAFFAEIFMAALLMAVVLWFSNRPSVARYTAYLVGVLIMFYILIFAPVSGFSINPARTTGSAMFADVWSSVWLYFVAPLGGMLLAAETHTTLFGLESILCAKLHTDSRYPCPFLCSFPLHGHPHAERNSRSVQRTTSS